MTPCSGQQWAPPHDRNGPFSCTIRCHDANGELSLVTRIRRPYESDITANGSGMIDLRHRLTGNETLSGRTFASGNLSVREEIRREYLP